MAVCEFQPAEAAHDPTAEPQRASSDTDARENLSASSAQPSGNQSGLAGERTPGDARGIASHQHSAAAPVTTVVAPVRPAGPLGALLECYDDDWRKIPNRDLTEILANLEDRRREALEGERRSRDCGKWQLFAQKTAETSLWTQQLTDVGRELARRASQSGES